MLKMYLNIQGCQTDTTTMLACTKFAYFACTPNILEMRLKIIISKLSQAEPNRAKPSQTEPNRAKQSQAKMSQAVSKS